MQTVQNDYSRQINILNPEKFTMPIHVIGGGATGSWLAFSLAKMGLENVTVYDFDEVGMHNLPNQMFGLRDIEQNKALSIKKIIRQFTGLNIKARNMKFESQVPLQGIVFVLTDTMKSRKDIYHRSIKNNPMIELLVETRMDLRGGRIYAIDPKDKDQSNMYENTFYSDDDAEVSACGVSQTALPTALGIVSSAMWKMINWMNEEEINNETILDFSNEIIMTQDWEKKEVKAKWTRENMVNKVFHCKTEISARSFAEICDSLNLTWRSGASLLNNLHWDHHEEETCYHVDDGFEVTYSNLEYFEERQDKFPDIIAFI